MPQGRGTLPLLIRHHNKIGEQQERVQDSVDYKLLQLKLYAAVSQQPTMVP
jgi:hypothetical protein